MYEASTSHVVLTIGEGLVKNVGYDRQQLSLLLHLPFIFTNHHSEKWSSQFPRVKSEVFKLLLCQTNSPKLRVFIYCHK